MPARVTLAHGELDGRALHCRRWWMLRRPKASLTQAPHLAATNAKLRASPADRDRVENRRLVVQVPP
eukprot:1277919-Pyramimonas_sp.AAC.1